MGDRRKGKGLLDWMGNERVDEVVDERRGAHREWEIQTEVYSTL
jgi:hypothetical protein